MSRAGSIHKDTSGLWSFVVNTAPLGAPRRQVGRGHSRKAGQTQLRRRGWGRRARQGSLAQSSDPRQG